MKASVLSPLEQRRLEKLARDAGRSPRQMLRFVLRDGFDFCEWEVRESRLSGEDTRQRGAVPHSEARERVRTVLQHGSRRRQAA